MVKEKILLGIIIASIVSLIGIGVALLLKVGAPKIEVIEDTTQASTEPEITEATTTEATTEEIEEVIIYNVPLDVEFQKELIAIAEEYELDPKLVLGVIEVESTYNLEAIGDGGASVGPMQIQPRWWSDQLTSEGVTDLSDPIQNVRAGCAILRDYEDRYGSEYMALQAYNTGNPYSNNGYAERVYSARDQIEEAR